MAFKQLAISNRLMTTDQKQIQAIFDRIAPVYDQLNDRLSLGQHRVWKLMTVKWIDLSIGDVCLDVCCGSGDIAQLVAQRVGETGQVFGVDFSSEQLAIARQRSQNQHPPLPITWIEADALISPFPTTTSTAPQWATDSATSPIFLAVSKSCTASSSLVLSRYVRLPSPQQSPTAILPAVVSG
jgi:SAM-dependent methyltransferase